VTNYDVTIIGGGIVGMATAMALAKKKNIKICVLEAEEKLAAHQTGNNSGVIHSGLYYKPGSLKARNCVEGRQKLYEFCRKHNIAHEQCGKVVVATRTEEIPALDELERKGHANGLIGLKRLSRAQINKYEPHITGIGGLLVPETGIVDYVQVTNKFAELVMNAGNEIKLKTAFTGLKESNNGLIIETTKGEIQSKNIINCAGLQSDRIARACGMDPGLRIIPFRGEYYELKPDKHHLINNLVYPVPDPAFPFLGVHFTRMIHGGVEAGPNAVLAFKREGYKKTSFSIKDSSEIFGYRGFLLLAAKFMKMGMGEFYRSFSKAAFVKALQRLLPEIESKDIVPGGAGVRAQALEKNGNLVDDFRIVQNDRMIHVLNAPSPAATASISIGEKIAIMAEEQFALI
jgi:L-2-hydroxyglutarate oxidase